jgi:predicted RND superfamily exporter protein
MHHLLGESPGFQEYLDLAKDYMNEDVIIIGFEDENPLSKPSLERLKAVIGKLEKIPDARKIHSILDVREIKVTDGVLSMESYAERALKRPELAKEILSELRADPLPGGMLISYDGRHSALIMEFVSGGDLRVENYTALIEEIRGIFKDSGYDPEGLHLTGWIPVLAEVMYQTRFNISRLFPIVCVLLLVTVFVMFRSLWPVAITTAVAVIAIIWTMGFAAFLFTNINILMAMSPVFIMIVAFSDVVHLSSSYLLELSRGKDKKQAIENSCSEVGKACLYTSMTTFVGFASLALVPVPLARQSGIILGFGVAVALLIAMTLSPILFSLMKAPKPWRVGATSKVQDLLDIGLSQIARLTSGHPWVIVMGFAALIGISIFGLYNMRLEADFSKRFSEDNRIQVDAKYFGEHFAGTSYLNIFVTTPEAGGLIEPEFFSRVSEFQDALLDIPEVDKIISVVDLVKILHREFQPEKARIKDLPETKSAIGQYMFLFEMSDSEDFERLIDFDRRIMCMTAHLSDFGIMSTHQTGANAIALGGDILGDKAEVKVMGLKYLLGKEFDQLVLSKEKKALLTAVITILIMMIIMLRSVASGLWAMIPNMIPLLAVAGWAGLFWDKVDTDIIMIFMIAIGIGVDDTIHFLMRYRIELVKSKDTAEAINRTFHYSGRAIVMTTVILVVGFAPFAFSDYFTTKMMGTMLPGCLVVALAADLLLVPALVKLGAFRLRTKKKN